MLEISLLSCVIAGILAFISPCILPIIPVYISMMSGKVIHKSDRIKISERLYLLINSILFVLGFSLVFIALGSTANLVCRLLLEKKKKYISATLSRHKSTCVCEAG